ncbi:membrane-associated protein, putative [Bodo saltans]|uniref:Membrane-associated protein, putative n=1 Tax=Bodo saltans TaxID=75058 RepID=A0A0S4KH92_BODSA|nr:membrane-associated protein, putative [Bodo saltans]|eukprot:CUI15084.1 membrane-associated protein, putative [Bodo saltans]
MFEGWQCRRPIRWCLTVIMLSLLFVPAITLVSANTLSNTTMIVVNFTLPCANDNSSSNIVNVALTEMLQLHYNSSTTATSATPSNTTMAKRSIFIDVLYNCTLPSSQPESVNILADSPNATVAAHNHANVTFLSVRLAAPLLSLRIFCPADSLEVRYLRHANATTVTLMNISDVPFDNDDETNNSGSSVQLLPSGDSRSNMSRVTLVFEDNITMRIVSHDVRTSSKSITPTNNNNNITTGLGYSLLIVNTVQRHITTVSLIFKDYASVSLSFSGYTMRLNNVFFASHVASSSGVINITETGSVVLVGGDGAQQQLFRACHIERVEVLIMSGASLTISNMSTLVDVSLLQGFEGVSLQVVSGGRLDLSEESYVFSMAEANITTTSTAASSTALMVSSSIRNISTEVSGFGTGVFVQSGSGAVLFQFGVGGDGSNGSMTNVIAISTIFYDGASVHVEGGSQWLDLDIGSVEEQFNRSALLRLSNIIIAMQGETTQYRSTSWSNCVRLSCSSFSIAADDDSSTTTTTNSSNVSVVSNNRRSSSTAAVVDISIIAGAFVDLTHGSILLKVISALASYMNASTAVISGDVTLSVANDRTVVSLVRESELLSIARDLQGGHISGDLSVLLSSNCTVTLDDNSVGMVVQNMSIGGTLTVLEAQESRLVLRNVSLLVGVGNGCLITRGVSLTRATGASTTLVYDSSLVLVTSTVIAAGVMIQESGNTFLFLNGSSVMFQLSGDTALTPTASITVQHSNNVSIVLNSGSYYISMDDNVNGSATTTTASSIQSSTCRAWRQQQQQLQSTMDPMFNVTQTNTRLSIATTSTFLDVYTARTLVSGLMITQHNVHLHVVAYSSFFLIDGSSTPSQRLSNISVSQTFDEAEWMWPLDEMSSNPTTTSLFSALASQFEAESDAQNINATVLVDYVSTFLQVEYVNVVDGIGLAAEQFFSSNSSNTSTFSASVIVARSNFFDIKTTADGNCSRVSVSATNIGLIDLSDATYFVSLDCTNVIGLNVAIAGSSSHSKKKKSTTIVSVSSSQFVTTVNSARVAGLLSLSITGPNDVLLTMTDSTVFYLSCDDDVSIDTISLSVTQQASVVLGNSSSMFILSGNSPTNKIVAVVDGGATVALDGTSDGLLLGGHIMSCVFTVTNKSSMVFTDGSTMIASGEGDLRNVALTLQNSAIIVTDGESWLLYALDSGNIANPVIIIDDASRLTILGGSVLMITNEGTVTNSYVAVSRNSLVEIKQQDSTFLQTFDGKFSNSLSVITDNSSVVISGLNAFWMYTTIGNVVNVSLQLSLASNIVMDSVGGVFWGTADGAFSGGVVVNISGASVIAVSNFSKFCTSEATGAISDVTVTLSNASRVVLNASALFVVSTRQLTLQRCVLLVLAQRRHYSRRDCANSCCRTCVGLLQCSYGGGGGAELSSAMRGPNRRWWEQQQQQSNCGLLLPRSCSQRPCQISRHHRCVAILWRVGVWARKFNSQLIAWGKDIAFQFSNAATLMILFGASGVLLTRTPTYTTVTAAPGSSILSNVSLKLCVVSSSPSSVNSAVTGCVAHIANASTWVLANTTYGCLQGPITMALSGNGTQLLVSDNSSVVVGVASAPSTFTTTAAASAPVLQCSLSVTSLAALLVLDSSSSSASSLLPLYVASSIFALTLVSDFAKVRTAASMVTVSTTATNHSKIVIQSNNLDVEGGRSSVGLVDLRFTAPTTNISAQWFPCNQSIIPSIAARVASATPNVSFATVNMSFREGADVSMVVSSAAPSPNIQLYLIRKVSAVTASQLSSTSSLVPPYDINVGLQDIPNTSGNSTTCPYESLIADAVALQQKMKAVSLLDVNMQYIDTTINMFLLSQNASSNATSLSPTTPSMVGLMLFDEGSGGSSVSSALNASQKIFASRGLRLQMDRSSITFTNSRSDNSAVITRGWLVQRGGVSALSPESVRLAAATTDLALVTVAFHNNNNNNTTTLPSTPPISMSMDDFALESRWELLRCGNVYEMIVRSQQQQQLLRRLLAPTDLINQTSSSLHQQQTNLVVEGSSCTSELTGTHTPRWTHSISAETPSTMSRSHLTVSMKSTGSIETLSLSKKPTVSFGTTSLSSTVSRSGASRTPFLSLTLSLPRTKSLNLSLTRDPETTLTLTKADSVSQLTVTLTQPTKVPTQSAEELSQTMSLSRSQQTDSKTQSLIVLSVTASSSRSAPTRSLSATQQPPVDTGRTLQNRNALVFDILGPSVLLFLPDIGFSALRATFAAKMLDCGAADDGTEDVDEDYFLLGFGPAVGQGYRGSIISSVVLCTAVVVFAALSVLFKTFITRPERVASRETTDMKGSGGTGDEDIIVVGDGHEPSHVPPRRSRSMVEIASTLNLPGRLIVGPLFFVLPTVLSSGIVLIALERSDDVAFGIACVLAALGCTIAVTRLLISEPFGTFPAYCVDNLRAHRSFRVALELKLHNSCCNAVALNVLGAFLRPPYQVWRVHQQQQQQRVGQKKRIDHTWIESYGCLFDTYRRDRHWYSLVELYPTLAICVISAVSIGFDIQSASAVSSFANSVYYCDVLTRLTGGIQILSLVLLLWLRPHIFTWETVLAGIIAVFGAVYGALVMLPDCESCEEGAAVCAQMQTILSVVVLVIEVSTRVVRRILLVLLGLLDQPGGDHDDDDERVTISPTRRSRNTHLLVHTSPPSPLDEATFGVDVDKFIEMDIASRLNSIVSLACRRRRHFLRALSKTVALEHVNASAVPCEEELGVNDASPPTQSENAPPPISQKQVALTSKITSQKQQRDELLKHLSDLRENSSSMNRAGLL